jgi:predicted RNA binding protein with dsRBD fold (UPF0201 family)
MNEINAIIKVKIFPTESVEKVKHAVENLFPTASTEISSQSRDSFLHATLKGKNGLTNLFNRLREERILAASRRVFRRGLADNSIIFYLNKQAAYGNHLSFCEPVDELPLGFIEVCIICDDPEGLIDWLSPKTFWTKEKRYS